MHVEATRQAVVVLSHPCLKAGDSSIRSWGAFGSLLRFVSLVSAINGGDCARPVFDTGIRTRECPVVALEYVWASIAGQRVKALSEGIPT